MKGTIQPYGEKCIPGIPCEDIQLHTNTRPFCFDPFCPCHENHEAIASVAQQVADGLVTLAEATRIVEGKTL